MKRLYVRPELCTGCKTCELACAVEHSRSKNLLGAMMESPPPHPRLYVEAVVASPFEILKMPMTCRHCDPALCIVIAIANTLDVDVSQLPAVAMVPEAGRVSFA